MLKDRGWNQSDLAQHAGLKQGVVSRAADPDYGNLTINTILKIASGFDVAYVGRFVPFSELARWYADLSEAALSVPDFNAELHLEVAAAASMKIERASSRIVPISVLVPAAVELGTSSIAAQPARKTVDSDVKSQPSSNTYASVEPYLPQIAGA
jgi:transcriptional regulator with XRE-family HTH domain